MFFRWLQFRPYSILVFPIFVRTIPLLAPERVRCRLMLSYRYVSLGFATVRPPLGTSYQRGACETMNFSLFNLSLTIQYNYT